MSTNRTVTITDNTTGKSVECPIIEGTRRTVINDIGLYPQLGMFTHDPGFGATSACRSTITYIDGDKILLYRATRSSNWPRTGHSSFATC